ncbi:uncharacterized protein LOC143287339 [Babylonia areolata]|uniref:uncharacterized protein LOC143287339 n=1 Tax=Babylonia areolata TaxID=304850 RepID=UPI003FD52533
MLECQQCHGFSVVFKVRISMLGAFVFWSLLGGTLCRPSVSSFQGNVSTRPLSPADREWLTRVPVVRTAYPPGFQFLYVARSGEVVEGERPHTGDFVEVVGSPLTPRTALHRASVLVGQMFRHTQPDVFTRIARKPGAGLGLFTAQEKVTVFPEAAYLRESPQCEGLCNGTCRHTCTSDRRKFANIPGITIGSRSFALVDNVLCTSHDPYGHHDNIAVHELGHCVQRVGLTHAQKRQLTAAYRNAKENGLWAVGSYAMASGAEYFAEGTGVYFLVNLYFSSGGMSNCHRHHRCGSEQEVRQHLHSRDPQLWSLLTDVYTQGNATLTSGLTICPPADV